MSDILIFIYFYYVDIDNRVWYKVVISVLYSLRLIVEQDIVIYKN